MADWVDIFKDKSQAEMLYVPKEDWEVMSRLLDRHIRRKTIMRWSLRAIPLAAASLAIVFFAQKDEMETNTPPERLVAETRLAESHFPGTDIVETNIVKPIVRSSSASKRQETVAIVEDEVTETDEPSTDVDHSEPVEPVVVDDNSQWWLETTVSSPARKRIARVDLSSSLTLLLQKASGQVLAKNGVSFIDSYSISHDKQQGIENPHLPELPCPVKIEHSHPYTLGIAVSFPLSDRFSISTGLDYSICDSRITYSNKSFVNQSAHYLGVPLRLDWIPLRTNKLFVYTGAGAEAYRCLFAKQGQDTRLKDAYLYYSAIFVGGLRYEPVRRVGLFIEPQFSYNFLRDDPAVLSAITDTKVLFNLKAGISFSFGR